MATVRVGDLTARDIGAGIKVILDEDVRLDGFYDRVTGVLDDFRFRGGLIDGEIDWIMDLSILTYKGFQVAITGLPEDFLVTVYER